MKPLVYIAGPVTHPKGGHWKNMHKACEVAERVVLAGAVPLIPQLSIAWVWSKQHRGLDIYCECGSLMSECECGSFTSNPVHGLYDDSEWIEMCLVQIYRCDAVFHMEGFSPGAEREVEFARAEGIPVFKHLGALAQWASAEVF